LKGILLVHRDEVSFALDGHFPLVKPSLFETQSDVLKGMILQS
jgi:hypothetical protein